MLWLGELHDILGWCTRWPAPSRALPGLRCITHSHAWVAIWGGLHLNIKHSISLYTETVMVSMPGACIQATCNSLQDSTAALPSCVTQTHSVEIFVSIS